MTVVALGASSMLSACRNRDLAAAPARGEADRFTGGGHSPMPEWRGDTVVFEGSEGATEASPVPERLYLEWAAQHTPAEATLRLMFRPRASGLAPAITCDPRSVKPAPAAESVAPAFLIGEDPTRCVVNPDSIAAQDSLLQIP
jgi:hypothetical protein